MDRRIGERQRWAWLAAGLSAAVAACICGISWIWVLAGSLPVTGYYIYVDTRLDASGLAAMLPQVFGGLGKVLAAATLAWTVAVMAWTANLADAAFPMVAGFPALGWVLLALAAWGSRKGAAACARCAGVLSLFLTILYGVVVVFAVPDVRLENLRPVGRWTDSIDVIGVFLLPAAVWYSPCTRSRKRPAWEMALILPLAAAALAAVTAGVQSPELASSLPAPLYSLTQSISLFGVVERIEPLLSAAMTMGVFCLLSAMACSCRSLLEQLLPWKWGGVAACGAAGVLMGTASGMKLPLLTAGTVAFWVLIPLATLWVRRFLKKKAKDGG